MVHAEIGGHAQKLKDSRLADRTRALRVIQRTLEEGSKGLGKQGLSKRSLLFNYGARVGMEHARRKQRGSEPSLLRRSLARFWAVSSIWGHWSGGLRGSWASRSPSLEADARAVLALMTGGRSVTKARYHAARAAGEQRQPVAGRCGRCGRWECGCRTRVESPVAGGLALCMFPSPAQTPSSPRSSHVPPR